MIDVRIKLGNQKLYNFTQINILKNLRHNS